LQREFLLINAYSANSFAWVYSLKKKMLIGIVGFVTVSIAIAMIWIALLVRNSLMQDSSEKTQELNDTIEVSLRALMLKRAPDIIQDTLGQLGKKNDSIVKAFILDKGGRIVYSSDRAEIGKVLNRFTDQSCRDCHKNIDTAPSDRTLIITSDGIKAQRNVKVLFNEKACHGCHAPSNRINGKLIIDRSLKHTGTLISSIELIMVGSAGACLILVVPFLRRKIDMYVDEISNKNRDVHLLAVMAKRLSNTIDVKELRYVAADVVSFIFDADEVDIVHPKNGIKYRLYTWDRTSHEMKRGTVDKSSELYSAINRWLADSLHQTTMSADGKQVYMPILKGNDTRLALIGVRRNGRPFDPERLKFIDAVCSHMAIAFENAYLYSIAITDELTHLYSHRHFRYCLEREISHFESDGNPFVLLLIDADNFKRINDEQGHVVGDEVLKETALCIASSLRDNDLAFRYGDEEFAVLLPSTDAEGGGRVAEMIRVTIEQCIFGKATLRLRMTVSIGMASCPKTANNSRDLLQAADEALSAAKEKGKNRIVISSSG